MKWFRFYSEALHDPKVQMLSPAMFKLWVNLLCLAAENGGVLPETCHFSVSLRSDRCQKYVSYLSDVGLFDVSADGLRPHNWANRQYESDDSAPRVKRYRNASRARQITDNRDRQQKQPVTTALAAAVTGEPPPLIFALYEQTIGSITPYMADVLKEAEQEYEPFCVTHAFQEAQEQNVRRWRYVVAILERHKAEGCYEREAQGWYNEEDQRRKADAQIAWLNQPSMNGITEAAG